MVGIPFTSFIVGAELSKPFEKYLSVSTLWSCWGTLRLVASWPHACDAFGKASAAVTLVGLLKCLDESCLHPSPWFSSHCSVTATLPPPGGTVRREPISKSCKVTQADNLNRRRRLSRKAQ